MNKSNRNWSIAFVLLLLLLCIFATVCIWNSIDSKKKIVDLEEESYSFFKVNNDYEDPGKYDAKVIKLNSGKSSDYKIDYDAMCLPGQLIGDVDRSGFVNANDAQIIGKIIKGIVDEPDNICCIDVDGDGDITDNDVLEVMNIFAGNSQSPGFCSSGSTPDFVCSSGQKIGDINGDGLINSIDALAIQEILLGNLIGPLNECCMDVDGDGNVSPNDAFVIMQIFTNTVPFVGYCN